MKSYFYQQTFSKKFLIVIVVVWKDIQSRSDTNSNGAECLSFYYPRLLCCPDQMLAVMMFSQHRVSSSKIVRPRAPCGSRCMGHAIRTWSAVCLEAPHSQFGEGVRPHLCMDEWNRPTPVLRRLSLTQPVWDKLIPTSLALALCIKTWSLEVFSPYYKRNTPQSIYGLSTKKRGFQVRQDCPKDSAQLAQIDVWHFVFLGKHLRTHLNYYTDMVRVQKSTGGEKECFSQSVKLSWLDS